MNNKISVDVDSLVKNVIQSSLDGNKISKRQISEDRLISESLVAEPKKFKQLSDSVSQKTKDAHYNDLYAKYVESFNKISAELDSTDRQDANVRHSKFRSLKLDETYNLNAIYLHELYFANCFDPNSEVYMDSMPYIRLQRDFGTFEDWQHDFMACALSSQEGWAVCGYNTFLKKFVNTFIDLHSNSVMIGLYPVVVVDMWSHAYYRDYLTDKKSFLMSQMKELNWKVIEERFLKVEKIAEALR